MARFAGAGDADKVDRTVYQAFLTAIGISLVRHGARSATCLSPTLLDLVNAAPAVKAEALPFLRVMFLFSSGMLMFFMLGGALRSAGDARTPMRLGHRPDGAEHRVQRGADPRPRPDPRVRHDGLGDGDVPRVGPRVGVRAVEALARRLGGVVPARRAVGPRLDDHPVAVPVRAADRHPGHRDERRRRAHARVHRIAGAERGRAGGVRRLVLAAVLADHLDVGRADGRGGGGGRAEPRRRAAGPGRRGGARRGAHRASRAPRCVGAFFLFSRGSCWRSSA